MTTTAPRDRTALDHLARVAGELMVKSRASGCDGGPLDALELTLANWCPRRADGALLAACERAVKFVRRRGAGHLGIACARVETALKAVR